MIKNFIVETRRLHSKDKTSLSLGSSSSKVLDLGDVRELLFEKEETISQKIHDIYENKKLGEHKIMFIFTGWGRDRFTQLICDTVAKQIDGPMVEEIPSPSETDALSNASFSMSDTSSILSLELN